MAIMRKTLETKAKKVSFSLDVADANSVMLAGDFNNWDYTSTPLRRDSSKSKTWKRDLTLRPGRYEYKFVVDGNWVSDPKNNNRVPNRFGSDNSVIEV